MTLTYNDYNSGHPWYYKLGGAILKPNEILEAVKNRGYQGYMAKDIAKASSKAEPARSKALAEIKKEVLCSLWRDISRYRQLACQLYKERQSSGIDQESRSCNDLHTSMSLKHNHIYNDLAHLHLLDGFLNQFELF